MSLINKYYLLLFSKYMKHLKAFFISLLVFGGVTFSFAQKSKEEKASRPNIVFIMSDDHAYQAISAYGQGLNHTPYIDSLAQQGILFNRAFVNNSLCAPSRASIISGKYSGNSTVKEIGDIFDGSQTTFPKELQNAGYQTALVGKWHLYSPPTGFDYWNILPGQGDYYQPDFIKMGDTVQVDGYVTNLITDDAIDWLEQRDTTKPFSVLIWHKAPHRNWMPELKYLNKFDEEMIPEPETLFDDYTTRTRAAREQEMEIGQWLSPNYDLKTDLRPDGSANYDGTWKAIFNRLTEEEQKAYEEAYGPKNKSFKKANLKGKELVRWKYQRYMKDYLRTVQTIDDNVGRVMDYLKENGLEENTIVIYTSDQGFYMGEHGWFDKRFMYEESFRTPLIMRWPEKIKPGIVSDAPVMNLDIGETLLDAAGVKIPEDMEGESFLPILEDKKPKDWRKYVYYQYYANDSHNVAKHIGVRSDRYKLIYFFQNNDWELYDLEKDPTEINNVYGQSEYKEVQNELFKVLKEKASKNDPDVEVKNNGL